MCYAYAINLEVFLVNILKTTILMALLTGLMVAIGGAVAGESVIGLAIQWF